jgi:multidrug resistance efflux pump
VDNQFVKAGDLLFEIDPRTYAAALDQASAELDETRDDLKDLEQQVKASVDGYVTNLTPRLGSRAVANQPALALVDVNSYWVHGFFRETMVGRVKAGDHAVIILVSYPDAPLKGIVDSIGWGIAQQDGSTGQDLLPTINATFGWIRLAQRVPVRVHVEAVPDEVALRVGTTASVLVRTGTAAGSASNEKTPPVPAALQ